MFSLEDSDAREMFITQTLSGEKDGIKLVGLLDEPMDFATPCWSLISQSANKKLMEFSDISDDDNCFEIPCSQKDIKTMATEERSVQHASVKRLNLYDFFFKKLM